MTENAPSHVLRLGTGIAPATDMAVVRLLFQEYANGLGFDLCFQRFDEELAGLPGCYAEPAGGIWLAWLEGMPAGCVALRPLGDGRAEMKRLYVRPAYAGQGLGRKLAEAAVAGARRRGYAAVRLDTLSSMTAANALYAKLGFGRIDAYCENPLPGALYYELRL